MRSDGRSAWVYSRLSLTENAVLSALLRKGVVASERRTWVTSFAKFALVVASVPVRARILQRARGGAGGRFPD